MFMWSKVMTDNKRRYGGFLFVEITVSLTVIAMLLAGVAFSLNGIAKFNHYQLVRQQCIAAAQAELDSLTATGKPIQDEDFSRIWPRLNVSIKKSAGQGQWKGTQLTTVTTSGKYLRKKVTIELSRYISRGEPLAEGK
jgi:type II secretory pathway pseudopilin PulG